MGNAAWRLELRNSVILIGVRLASTFSNSLKSIKHEHEHK
jgi:hypothetical protein